jgi:hypothetical protein
MEKNNNVIVLTASASDTDSQSVRSTGSRRVRRSRRSRRRSSHRSHYGPMYSVFHTIIMVFALYLSFKCNNGFNPVDFLLACCCPVLYIIYRAATSQFCTNPMPGSVPKLA